MTAKEQVIDLIIRMPEEKLIRAFNLLERFNWDVKAALEYLENGGEA